MSKRNVVTAVSYMTGFLFIICIPLFLLTSNIRWVTNDLHFHQKSFEKYSVSQETGFSRMELGNISESVLGYLNGGPSGDALNVFTENEMQHLKDVKGLIQLNYVMQWSALGYIVIFIAGGFMCKRRQFLYPFSWLVTIGSIAGIIGVAAVGLAALADFEGLFIAFHHLFFTNDLWVSSGYLPRIYTEGFFYDAARFIALATVIEALFIGVIAGFFIIRRRRLTS